MTHVLCCRLDNAGDVVLTGPAVRAVAATADRVSYLCGPRGVEAAQLLPGVDEVLVHRAGWIDPDGVEVDKRSIDRLVEDVGSTGADTALIFTSFHQSPLPTALVARMAGVRSIAGISDDFPGSLLDVRHRLSDDLHEVERNLSLAATLGFRLPAGDDGRLHLATSPPGQGLVPDDPYVVVHPGSTAPARTWDEESFARTIDLLVEDGWKVVVTGGASESGMTGRLAGRRRAVTDLGGRTTLATLGGVIAGAAAVVCGNTGPAHVAAAVGTPVVELYAPTVPAARWRPWGVPHLLLGDAGIACAGCRATTCPVPGHPCLSSVLPSDVVGAVRRVVSDRDFLFSPPAVRSVVA
jgi:ADP-heptose:LPS heptosyltransferase